MEILVTSSRGNELIDVLAGGGLSPVAADAAANELLGCIFHGYPVENIDRLVYSGNDQAVQAAAWVISELGAEASQLLGEIQFLLSHPARNARFFAVSATLATASANDGVLLAKATSLISDAEEAVRWQALRLLSRLPASHLQAAAAHITKANLRRLVTWLSDHGDDPASTPEILRMLRDPEQLTRLVAASASARLFGRDRRAIDNAANSRDQDVRTFATRELAMTAKPPT
jgi:HEAT repeat protein